MDTAIYTRISLDTNGTGLGVARQETACRAKAKALGWTVQSVYVDNGVSASKAVPRPEYERLMADLGSGAVKALVVYDLDRLTRKPAELETFIALADTHGIALANVSGDVDLTNANGRMIARLKGAVARQEAERIGERVSAQKRQRAESGKPGGGRYRVFGYTREWTLEPHESSILADAFLRVATGESVTSIFNDWNSKGYKTVAGSDFKHSTLKKLLTRAGYAGLRDYKGSIIGKTSYPAIVDEATFEAAQAKMKEKGWSNKGKGTKRYLLSGIATCNECLHPMYGAISGGKDQYRCKQDVGGCGKVSMKIAYVDLIIRQEVMVKAQEAPTEAVPTHDYTADIEAVDSRIEALQVAHRTNALDLADLLPLLRAEREDRAALVKEAGANVQDKYADLFKPWQDWNSASTSAKRVTISRYIKAVMVSPNTNKGSKAIDYSRITILWQDGTTSKPLTPVFIGRETI